MLQIPRQVVSSLFSSFDRPTQAYIDFLVECLERSRQRVHELLTMNVERRLAVVLADLSAESRTSVVTATQQELADFLGTSRGVVNAAISSLIDKRLVAHPARGRGLLVADPNALRRFAESALYVF
jgi:CRP-like cAMP-binding protein